MTIIQNHYNNRNENISLSMEVLTNFEMKIRNNINEFETRLKIIVQQRQLQKGNTIITTGIFIFIFFLFLNINFN